MEKYDELMLSISSLIRDFEIMIACVEKVICLSEMSKNYHTSVSIDEQRSQLEKAIKEFSEFIPLLEGYMEYLRYMQKYLPKEIERQRILEEAFYDEEHRAIDPLPIL